APAAVAARELVGAASAAALVGLCGGPAVCVGPASRSSASTPTIAAASIEPILELPIFLGRTGAASPAREDDIVRDDLGLVALVAVLVVVARRAERPLDEDRGPFREDLGQSLPALAPDHDVVPVGSVTPDFVLVEIRFGGRQPHVEYGLPA